MKAYLEIEMPRYCNKCPLFVYEGQGVCDCRVLPSIKDGEILKPWKNKRKDCPLVPVPPHGRLIDADALEKDIDKYIGGEESRSRFHHWVQVQSVVIPGNKGEQT